MKLTYIAGQTPLDPNESAGLIPTHITLQRELDELEFVNISKAVGKYMSASGKKVDLTDPLAIKQIHRDMLKDVWKWAGEFRSTDKTIGIFSERISEELKKACGDLDYWIKNKTYSHDEIAVRFHHRLVWIHLFPNGNGRHARIVADIFLLSQGVPPFSWGSGNLSTSGPDRNSYISALGKADEHDFSDLLSLCRK